jgi:ATP-binding cassette subfamily F protein uup
VDAAEKRVSELEGKLADPELYAKRGSEVAGLQAELAAAKEAAAKLVARWEELEQRKG